MAMVEKAPEIPREELLSVVENAGGSGAVLRGGNLYFRAPTSAVASEVVRAMRLAGIDHRSLNPAILEGKNVAFLGDQVVVKLRPDKELEAFRTFAREQGAREIGCYRYGDHYRLVLRTARDDGVIDLANRIQETGWSVFSQPDFISQGKFPYRPDDDLFREEQEDVFRLFHIPEAWNVTQGDPDIAVAVFDSGYRLDHPDLGDNLVAPYDALNDDDDPEMESELDFHGTLVLGLIGADTDNGRGVAGVGFHNSAVPVKIGRAVECFLGGEGCAEFTCSAITRAADHVLNLSEVDVAAVNLSIIFFGDSLRTCFEDALGDIHQFARGGAGAVIVAGTGNDGLETTGGFPVSFPFVIGAGESSDDGSQRGFRSNFGPFVDLMARGTETTTRRGTIGLNEVTDDYFFFAGTSAATAVVSGIAGLVASVNPARTASEIESILLHSADRMLPEELEYGFVEDHVVGMKNVEVGFGRVNAFKSVRMASRRKIPRSAYPLLYTSNANGARLLYVLDKDADRNWPNASELEVTALEMNAEPLANEYLAAPLPTERARLLYRAGSNEEILQVLDPTRGFGPVVHRRSLSLKRLPAAVTPYEWSVPPARREPDQFVTMYSPGDGMQRTYRLRQTLMPSPASVELVLEREEPLALATAYSYSFLKQGDRGRLVRYSPGDRRLDFIAIDESGLPAQTTGSITFSEEERPELWAVYSGRNASFLYTQADPFSYVIAEITFDGEVLRKETHNSSFADTPYDRIAIHHVYDQDRPFLLFWKNNGVVKVKHLISDLELAPFATNVKSFRTPSSPAQLWSSSAMLGY